MSPPTTQAAELFKLQIMSNAAGKFMPMNVVDKYALHTEGSDESDTILLDCKWQIAFIGLVGSEKKELNRTADCNLNLRSVFRHCDWNVGFSRWFDSLVPLSARIRAYSFSDFGKLYTDSELKTEMLHVYGNLYVANRRHTKVSVKSGQWTGNTIRNHFP